jgi:hypothetical protein
VSWDDLLERLSVSTVQTPDVRTTAAVWYTALNGLARASLSRALLVLALASCDVYDPSLLAAKETSEAGGARDVAEDMPRADGVGPGPMDGTGGGNHDGSGGADVRDVGSGGAGGRDAGDRDTGIGGTGPHDAVGGDAVADGGDTGGFAGHDSGRDGDADASGGVPDASIGCADAGGAGCADSTADAVDVIDRCPTDPGKTEPGACGCGTPDTDSDNDRTADCIDGCPNDVRKTAAGLCGCNAEDPLDRDAGQAFCIKAFLAHRYSFNGTGTVASDSIAAAHGAIVGGNNAVMSGGSVSLSGDLGSAYGSEGYVNLPSNLLTPLAGATFEVWVTWRGTGASGNLVWQRIFDFGSQVTAGSALVGDTYLFLTPYATSTGLLRAGFSTSGNANETFVSASRAFPLNAQAHVAVVVDDANDAMTLYLDGDPDGTVAWSGTLAAIDNVNSWLGRSNFAGDPEFNGLLHEFRIYRVALTAAQIQASYLAGPDPAFF